MKDIEMAKRLDRIVMLLLANLAVMAIGTAGLLIGLMPAIVRLAGTTERVEQRFQSFADEVQPVVSSGAGKAIESIKKIDSDRLSKTATKRTDELIDSASERARRFLERDRKEDAAE